MSYEGDYSPIVTTDFTRATGIPVTVQSLPWTASHEKLLTAQAGGALPHVFMLPNAWVPEFAMIGALAEVPAGPLVEGLFPGTADAASWNGRGWGIPWAVAPQVQYYRRDLLAAAGVEAPPVAWEPWKRAMRAVKARNPDGFAVLMLLNWPDALFTFAGQLGARGLRERDTLADFGSPAFREALGFYASIFAEGLAPRALSTEVQDPFAAFASGWIAVYPSGPVTMRDLARRAADIPRNRWATQPMPGPQGVAPVTGLNSSIVVSAAAASDARAWALARHLTGVPAELRYFELIGSLPARTAAWATPMLREDPAIGAFRTQLDHPARQPRIVEWERIREEVQRVAERLVRGLLTLEEATAEMNRRADRILAKRRALVQAGRLA